MRVFHLIKSLGRGGAETLLLEGLKAADRERFHLAYGFFVPWKDALVAPLQEEGAPVYCFPARRAPAMLARLPDVVHALRRFRPDVIHAHLPLAGALARAAGRLLDVPVLYTEHNLMERYHPATRAVNLATWPIQSRVIAVSEDVKTSAERHAGTRVPIDVVKNGVSLTHFRRDEAAGRRVRAELGIPKDAKVVGTVAVFRVQKRLDDWLEAAARALRVHEDAHFLLVGDGPLRAEVEAKRRELKLEGRAHLVGLQEEVRPYLSAMDVYMMSSVFEGLPVALLEAMAMELPVVATTVGGIPEVVREGESGHLVAPERPAELADALCRLLSSPRRAALGEAGRRVVAERFSMERMQREIEGLYLETVARWSEQRRHRARR